jgi:tetratricopeptide (TPR) repeat protein
MYAEAIALCEKSLQRDPNRQSLLRALGVAYAKTDRRSEAEGVIKQLKDIARTQYVLPYYMATIYAALGERDNAFVELEKAYTERDWFISRVKVDPFLDPLRDDPRFQDLVKRVGLP